MTKKSKGRRFIGTIVILLIALIFASCKKNAGFTIVYFPGTLESPVFSPEEGSYADTVMLQVEIYSGEPGAEIRYTFDGSIPTDDTGLLYVDPIALVDDAVITAVAFKEYCRPSPPATASYAITPPDDTLPPHVIFNFTVDDTANMTYTQGELFWYGSIAYDSVTNFVDRDPSWMGPFPVLWDDGPGSEGGHEPEGSTAGDNIWGVTVLFETPDADVDFEYGVRNSDDQWIWIGPNGSFTVPAGSEDQVFDPAGLVIPAHGDVDFKVEFDYGEIDGAFTFDPLVDTVSIKTSSTDFQTIEFFDDGLGEDTVADDGIYTFVLSENVGSGTDLPHYGLMHDGAIEAFLLVISTSEYKGTDALDSGVTAFSMVPLGPWDFEPITITFEYLLINDFIPEP